MTAANGNLATRYRDIRSHSEAICQTLEAEDYQVQPMDNASPPKWHLAHVSWFFETFILKPLVPCYQSYNEAFEVLYNSYYNGVGQQFPRARRGHLSRPTVADIVAYRKYVDREMGRLLANPVDDALAFRVELGLQHEQQHQELLYTDIKYNLGNNPLFPALLASQKASTDIPTELSAANTVEPMNFMPVSEGIREIGWQTSRTDFCFDNETPRHRVLVGDFEIGHRLVTNGEFLEFIGDNGYSRPELWLSDAWAFLADENIAHPLYWVPVENGWQEYTLHGLQPLQPDLPVSHVSGYEADAYARWAQARLPTEQEWEVAADELAAPTTGNFRETGILHPAPATGSALTQMFGDLWEWTSSSYGPYPGFKPFDGQLGEYNGKFMANQLVLRGGSCVSPQDHIRTTYRNFFYPNDRWQFSGIRLARDL